jgi:hypothetical protein
MHASIPIAKLSASKNLMLVLRTKARLDVFDAPKDQKPWKVDARQSVELYGKPPASVA